MNPSINIHVIDQEDSTAAILQAALRERGYLNVSRASSPREAGRVKLAADVLVLNYHFENPESIVDCVELKAQQPDAALITVVSAGPGMSHVRTWNRQSRVIDAIIEKPLSDDRFFSVLDDLATARRAARQQQHLLEQLSRLVPEPALRTIRHDPDQSAQLFEAAILFTDIRRSTQQITSLKPGEYFTQLNQVLSAQTLILEQHEGVLVKYTGDGLLAMFCGLGRARLALAAAMALAADSRQHSMAYGLGLAHGLVLGGFVGDPSRGSMRRQYDVVGATVHLAARLCSLAPAGGVYAQRSLLSQWNGVPHVDVGPVAIRGFDVPINCVALKPAMSEANQA